MHWLLEYRAESNSRYASTLWGLREGVNIVWSLEGNDMGVYSMACCWFMKAGKDALISRMHSGKFPSVEFVDCYSSSTNNQIWSLVIML